MNLPFPSACHSEGSKNLWESLPLLLYHRGYNFLTLCKRQFIGTQVEVNASVMPLCLNIAGFSHSLATLSLWNFFIYDNVYSINLFLIGYGWSVPNNPSFSLLSSIIVTGPSLWISTSMCAWKQPVSTLSPVARMRSTKRLNSDSAC
jgi:hypothetical protein